MFNRLTENRKKKRNAKEKEKIAHALIDAVRRNDIERVTKIVKKYGSDSEIINHAHRYPAGLFDGSPSRIGATALDRAVQNNNLEMVKVLVSAPGINANTESCYWPPIYMAAVNRNAEMVKVLAGAPGVKCKFYIEGEISLVCAVISYCESALPAVLSIADVHVDVNRCDRNREFPLHYAVKKGNMSAVEGLLLRGANANMMNSDHETPLDVANIKGYTDIANLLRPHTDEMLVLTHTALVDHRQMLLAGVLSRI